jgi:hypothetical protein
MLFNNLAGFKRAMEVGSSWSVYDSRTGVNTSNRECTVSQTKSFALNNHPNRTDKSEGSWLDYPKAKEIMFIQEEGESTKVRVNLYDNEYLIYQRNS